MISISTIFIIGLVTFTLASLWFLFSDRSSVFNSALLVAGVTALSYALMLDGSLAFSLGAGEVAHWTRWAGYALSCSLLMYVISAGVQPKDRRFSIVGITPLVMLSGALAAATTGWLSVSVFILGSVWYGYMLYLLFQYSETGSLDRWRKYIWFGWTAFPVVFVLSPVYFAVISSTVAAILYLFLDVFTKIIFYVEKHHVQKQKQSGMMSSLLSWRR